MLVKTAFAIILVSVATAMIDIKNLQEWDLLQKQTPAETVSCCPEIALRPPASIIDSLYGYRAYFEIIVDYGNCTQAIADDSTFYCCGTWGDDTPQNCTISHKLGNCEMAHQYPKDNKSYTVGATYCNVINQNDLCCSTLSKIITVTN